MLLRADETLSRILEVFDALNCGVLLLDRTGEVLYANGRLCELMRRDESQLLGCKLRKFYDDCGEPEWVERVFRSLHCGVEQEFFLPRLDGLRQPVLLSGRPVKSAHGREGDLVVTMIDIARQKEAEEDAREQLETVSKLGDTVMKQAIALEEYSHTLEERVRERTRELDEAYREAITMLAVGSEAKDADTGAHVRRIQRFVEAMARKMGMPEALVEQMGYSAILHDVGKMQVPDEILKKPAALTPDERIEIELHTLVGERILSKKPFFDMARQVARSHHENWDGTGYPDRLNGEELPLAARIVHLVDVYDGLTSQRAYKPAWPAELAAKTIFEGSGKLFDPRIVEAFRELYDSGEIERIRGTITIAT